MKDKNKKPLSPAKKIAFSAVLCALGVIILFLGAIIETVDITMAAMASFLIIVCMIEIGGYMPFLVFAVTAALALLLLPNKTVVLIYAMYFGFYPILKNYLERLPPLLSWVLKFVVFNIATALYYTFMREVLFAGIENMKLYIILIMNVIFFTLDMAQTLFVTAYVRRFRRLLGIHRLFK